MALYFGYFNDNHKGDIAELRQQLQSLDLEKRTTAAERALKQLLRGKNLDALFPDVLKCARTDCFKLKKTVYMFLSLTAEKQPDLAMLVTNTLGQDLSSHLPIVRALALRTIVRMNIETLTQHLAEPLRASLSDEDPYVRKTAAICIAKLSHTQGSWIKEMGLLDRLREMLTEPNVAVLVNVLAALMEAGEFHYLKYSLVSFLLAALDEANEWGKIVILEALRLYKTDTFTEMKTICARIIPFLAHVNAAVVLTALRVILPLIDALPKSIVDSDDFRKFQPRLSSSLKTLLSSQPEIQYVVLRNIPIILQKYPDLFKNDYRSFFIKYYDPIYVKTEKLEIMIRLAVPENMLGMICEFEEYAKEADVDLVRNAVRALGRCAIRVPETSGLCVNSLLGLLNTDIEYILESVVIAFRDIFRRYPGQYESALVPLSEHIETLNDCEARAAFIWMLGEYCQYINNADEIMASFAQDFSEQDSNTQLAILTATVKLFLNQPESSNLVQSVLEETITLPNPDLRDRAFIYWRLLSTDPNTAKMIVLAEKPPISDRCDNFGENLINQLLQEIGSLASVYHKRVDCF